MYRIGEFSYLFKVTVRTLLHYEKKGVFLPSYVDPFTGYRYYGEEQKEEFLNILKMKELGFSLDEIKNLKEGLSMEEVEKKIGELLDKKGKIEEQLVKLEKLNCQKKTSCEIGLTFNQKFLCIGYRQNVEGRNKDNEQALLVAVSEKLRKLKINHHTKVIITEEVGYKKEDIDLFIGYLVLPTQLNDKKRSKLKKLGLEIFEYPTSDYLVALDVLENQLADVCSEMVAFAGSHHIQILGPFMEFYDDEKISVYVFAEDLRKCKDIVLERREIEWQNCMENAEFQKNDKIIGTWKIREILPNISFSPEKHKSTLDTRYPEICFLENGKTNYENVCYNGSFLIISYEGRKTYNLIDSFEMDGKEYLEIRMCDLSMIEPTAKPISYIYEKV